jgi:hypothetical protein
VNKRKIAQSKGIVSIICFVYIQQQMVAMIAQTGN